jgi:hypothetical protein
MLGGSQKAIANAGSEPAFQKSFMELWKKERGIRLGNAENSFYPAIAPNPRPLDYDSSLSTLHYFVTLHHLAAEHFDVSFGVRFLASISASSYVSTYICTIAHRRVLRSSS